MKLGKKVQPNGFTLIEVLVAIAISSTVLLASVKLLPVFNQSVSIFQRQFRLELLNEQILQVIEKDIKRAGFCVDANCQGDSIILSASDGETANSCLIIRYDLNKNGIWDNSGDEAEFFAYRLKQGVIETHRSQNDCNGVGWEKLLDQDEVVISHFEISELLSNNNFRAFKIRIETENTAKTKIQNSKHSLEKYSRSANLS